MLITWVITLATCAATPAEDNAALRSLVTAGWETGAYETAQEQITALADARTAPPVQLAITLTHLRHNLADKAKAELIAAGKEDMATLTLLAWISAAEGKHAAALSNFELALAAEKTAAFSPDVFWLALGRYFGYLETGAAGHTIRAPYFAARGRLLSAASEAQRAIVAREQAAVALRLGQSPAFAGPTAPVEGDAAKIDAQRKRALGDIDRRLETFNAEYRRQAQTVQQLQNALFVIELERQKYADKTFDPFALQLAQGSALRVEACKIANAQAVDLAEKAGLWTEQRRFLARLYDGMLQQAKGAPAAGSLVPLSEACEFPFDAARQSILLSLLSDAERKALKPAARLWTDRRGKRDFAAELVSFDGQHAMLRSIAGKELKVALDSLSHVDQDFLDSTRAPTRADVSLASNQLSPGVWYNVMPWVWRENMTGAPDGWSHRDRHLTTPERSGGKQLMLPLHLRGASYELVLEATQWSEGYTIVVVPVGSRNVNVILGPLGRKLQWHSGREDWGEMILYKLRERFRIGISVKLDKENAEINISVNDKVIQTWKGKQSDLDGWGIPDRAGIALGAWDATVSYHALRFRFLAGEAERVGASSSPGKQSAADPIVSDAVFKLIQLRRATYGAGELRADVTEQVRTSLADPFIGVQVDSRSMGDPAPNQPKQLKIDYEIDGKPAQLVLAEGKTATLPALPEEGIPMPMAKAFRIVGARYGGGSTWVDVTRMVAERVQHPGEVVNWGGLSSHDPWHGMRKNVVVWFDYEGRRYARILPDGENHALLASAVASRPGGTFTATVTRERWAPEKTAPVKLANNDEAFGLLSEVGGDFAGEGEEVRLELGKDNFWKFGGKAGRGIAGYAMMLNTPLREQFDKKPLEFTWSNKNQSPVKMINASEGFCVLASIGGNFAGSGEDVGVFIDPHTQDWYLHGRSQQPLTARAYAYRLKKNHNVKLKFTEYHWHPGYKKIDLLPGDQGFCYLSAVGGNFAGFGEQVRVVLGEDGRWNINGTSAQPLAARAIAVRVERTDK